MPLTIPVPNGEAAEDVAVEDETEPEPAKAAVEAPTEPEPQEPEAVEAPASDAAERVTVVPFDATTEFNGLPKNKASVNDLPGSVESLMYANRYRDVLPNGHSRVKLTQLGANILTTYINANFMRSYDGTADWYIAAQGPKPETLIDFWRMVWEKNSEAIVMTTGITEGGRVKCNQYWPSEPTEAPFECGDYKVATKSKKRIGAYLLSELDVTFGGQTRKVAHFWYDSWPDHGAPAETKGVTDMLQAVKARSAGGAAHPWIVHCSAGIGRTGTFIGIDMGMHQLNTSRTTSVKELVNAMRADRGGTVQTAVQADFIHKALVKYAAQVNANGGPPKPGGGTNAPSKSIQRTLIRAVVGMAAKMGKYEAEIRSMMAELGELESMAVNAQAQA